MQKVIISGIGLVAPPVVCFVGGLLGLRRWVRNALAVLLSLAGISVCVLLGHGRDGIWVGLVVLPLASLLFGVAGNVLRKALSRKPGSSEPQALEVSFSVKDETIGDGLVCEGIMAGGAGIYPEMAEMTAKLFLALTDSPAFLLGTSEKLRDVMTDLSQIDLKEGPLQKRWQGRLLSGTVTVLAMDRAELSRAFEALQVMSPNIYSFCLCPLPEARLPEIAAAARNARSVEALAQNRAWLPLMEVSDGWTLMIYTRCPREEIARIVREVSREHPNAQLEYEELPPNE